MADQNDQTPGEETVVPERGSVTIDTSEWDDYLPDEVLEEIAFELAEHHDIMIRDALKFSFSWKEARGI